jgi:hypothetical protein
VLDNPDLEQRGMITFRYSLSNISVVILFGGLTALVFAAAPLLRKRLLGQVTEAHSEIARTTMTTVTGFTGVVLAFSLLQAQGQSPQRRENRDHRSHAAQPDGSAPHKLRRSKG